VKVLRGLPNLRKALLFSILLLLICPNFLFPTFAYQSDFSNNEEFSNNWFDSQWEHRWTINFHWSFTQTLHYHQAQVLLPDSFDYDLVDENGDDIRFTSIENEELPYWIERWVLGGISRIWVIVPVIGSSLYFRNNIYLYAGNENAMAVSNGTATFEYFDNFENQEIGEHPGGWSISQTTYGDLVVAGNGRSGNNSIHYTDHSNIGSPKAYLDFDFDIMDYILEFYVWLDYDDFSGGLAYTTTSNSLNGGNTLFGVNDSNTISCFNGTEWDVIIQTCFSGEWMSMKIGFRDREYIDQTLDRRWGQSITDAYFLFLYGGIVSSIDFLQFWQFDAEICSMFLDCIRIRKQNDVYVDPVSFIIDFIEFKQPESTIVGFSLLTQIIGFSILLVISDIIFRKRKISWR